jgi:hypothetical protein
MSKSLRLVVLAVLVISLVSVSTLAQVVLTDDANTSSLFAKTNSGSSIALIVCSGSNTYFKFSFANLGPGITNSNVSKATLVLYADFVLTSGNMDVYQVNGSWSEGSVTYNTAPAVGAKLFSSVSVTKTRRIKNRERLPKPHCAGRRNSTAAIASNQGETACTSQ